MCKQTNKYLAALAASAAFFCACVLLINSLVDPLWYFSGNRLGSVNFAFNERLSKANRFLADKDKYDCVIFGDSRVTLLPEQKIIGYSCFNFAFSAGRLEEILAYADYLKAQDFAPKLVILGLSGTEFTADAAASNIPHFIKEKRKPTSAYLKYLSLDVLGMSWRTLFGKSPIDRTYDWDFHCHVAVGSMQYDPAVPIRDFMLKPFTGGDRTEMIGKLRDIFPEADFYGYVPPISAWAIDTYAHTGWLKDYIEPLHKAADSFDRFFDFGVPSSITIEPDNTYDGTHYSEESNTTIADSLMSGDQGEALDLKAIDEAEMHNVYIERLVHYAPRLSSGLE